MELCRELVQKLGRQIELELTNVYIQERLDLPPPPPYPSNQ